MPAGAGGFLLHDLRESEEHVFLSLCQALFQREIIQRHGNALMGDPQHVVQIGGKPVAHSFDMNDEERILRIAERHIHAVPPGEHALPG